MTATIKQNWTKEPWSVGDALGLGVSIHTKHSGHLVILDAVRDARMPSGGSLRVAIRSAADKGGIMRKVADLDGDPSTHPDLRRIVSCVNAMEGMPEFIDGLHVLTVLKECNEMAKENARFKDALKRCIEAIPRHAQPSEMARAAEVILAISTVALKEPS